MTSRSQLLADRITDYIVERCATLVLVVLLISITMVWFAAGLAIDPNLESVYDVRSPEYTVYKRFMDAFGNDESVLVVVKNHMKVGEPTTLNALVAVTQELSDLERVSDVYSIENLRLPGITDGKFGSYPVVIKSNDRMTFDENRLRELRETWPAIGVLVSEDLRTVGVVARLEESLTFGPWTLKLLEDIESVVKRHFPPDSRIHMVGVPVMKAALLTYNRETALRFGVISALIAALIAVYIFKSLWVVPTIFFVGALSVLWIAGLMSLIGVPLNASTSVCFGMVFILTVPTVVHIVTHFNDRYREIREKPEAVKQSLRTVGLPCFMCSLTTSVGFGSMMLSPIPSLSLMGLIMSSGVLFSFILAFAVVPSSLLTMKPLGEGAYNRMSTDILSLMYRRIGDFVFARSQSLTVIGLIFGAAMLAGIPFIRADAPLNHILADRTPEAQDIRFVEKNLIPFDEVSVMVEGTDNTFKKPGVWKQIAVFENRVAEISEVYRTESLVPLLRNLSASLSDSDAPPSELFDNPQMIPQLLFLVSSSQQGKRALAEYVTDDYRVVRIRVRLLLESSSNLNATLQKIRALARSELNGLGNVSVTGHLAMGAVQAITLIHTQVLSLVVALIVITILIAAQLRSICLGIVSLIPNALPLAVIFGVMGWFGIVLDSMTILVAAISYGLSVDDTIHYLTQLEREMNSKAARRTLTQALRRAYQITARAMITTSAVLCFSLLSLAFAPFRPAASFGILAALAAATALVGDIVFLPSLTQSSATVRKLMTRGFIREEERLEG